ncbi:uncharacterized protein [Diadema setosum]|uniref:uncharacterized protein n=1 Tax=Diadema setosum TaxID=31175 RepID=UPI003B3A9FDA
MVATLIMEGDQRTCCASALHHGCQRHCKLQFQPLPCSEEWPDESQMHFAALLERSFAASQLGDIDVDWFSEQRWSGDEKDELPMHGIPEAFTGGIPKTPLILNGRVQAHSTPGLFTPDAPRPARRIPKVDEEHAQSPCSSQTCAQPSRMHRVPSNIQTTPQSQVITSHQPASSPSKNEEDEEEEEEEEEEVGQVQSQDQLQSLQISPFTTWNPTSHRAVPIFTKHLFKTPSSPFEGVEKRASSTPLHLGEPIPTPKRLSTSLGIESDDCNLSWTSSLATPPISSRGSKMTTSSTRKAAEEEYWKTHDVAKVLFLEASPRVEYDIEGENLTQPLPVVKLPSITDESQEDFTMETEDSAESLVESEVAQARAGEKINFITENSGGCAAEVKTATFKEDDTSSSNNNHCSMETLDKVTAHGREDLVTLSKSSAGAHVGQEASTMVNSDKKMNHMEVSPAEERMKHGRNVLKEKELEHLTPVSKVLEKSESGGCFHKHVTTAQEYVTRKGMDDNHNVYSILPQIGSSRPCQRKAESGVTPPGSQNVVHGEDKPAIGETLAFLLATPPSRKARSLTDVCALGIRDTSTSVGQFLPDPRLAEGSNGNANHLRAEGHIDPLPKDGIECGAWEFPTKPRDVFVSQDLLHPGDKCPHGSSSISCCVVCSGVPTCSQEQLRSAAKRPVGEAELLSPISPNFAEALCRVTDRASAEQTHMRAALQSLGPERNLIEVFHRVSTPQLPSQSSGQSSHGQVTDSKVPTTGRSDSFGLVPEMSDESHPDYRSENHVDLTKQPASLSLGAQNLPDSLCTVSSAIAPSRDRIQSQKGVKSRFQYSASSYKESSGTKSLNSTPQWMTRAVYVEEDEEEKKMERDGSAKVDAAINASSDRESPMRKPHRTRASFTTFSTFCKTSGKNASSQPMATPCHQTKSQSTTPTSRRPSVLSAPPHCRMLSRGRQIYHSLPSPKRLRLDEEGKSAEVKHNSHPIDESKSTELEGEQRDVSVCMDLVEPVSVEVGSSHPKVGAEEVDLPCRAGPTVCDVQSNKLDNSLNTIRKPPATSAEAHTKASETLPELKRLPSPEDYQHMGPGGDACCGFQSASGKSIVISDAAMSRAQQLIGELAQEENVMPLETVPKDVGFSSASGKTISVSAAALAKAEKFMSEISELERPPPLISQASSGTRLKDGGTDDAGGIQAKEDFCLEGWCGRDKEDTVKERKDYNKRPKGFRPFKPPMTSLLVGSEAKVCFSNSKEAAEGHKQDRETMSHVAKTSTNISHEYFMQEKQIFRNSNNLLPDEMGRVHKGDCKQGAGENQDISMDDCLSSTQTEQEIKAAEEMELVYNFMQEEDAGFSQLDVSSILLATHSREHQLGHYSPVRKQGDTLSSSLSRKQGDIEDSQHAKMHRKSIACEGSDKDIVAQSNSVSSVEKEGSLDGTVVQSSELSSIHAISKQHLLLDKKSKDASQEEDNEDQGKTNSAKVESPGQNMFGRHTADISLGTIRELPDESFTSVEPGDIHVHGYQHTNGRPAEGTSSMLADCSTHVMPEGQEHSNTPVQQSKILAAEIEKEESLSYHMSTDNILILPHQRQEVECTSAKIPVGFQTEDGNCVENSQAAVETGKQLNSGNEIQMLPPQKLLKSVPIQAAARDCISSPCSTRGQGCAEERDYRSKIQATNAPTRGPSQVNSPSISNTPPLPCGFQTASGSNIMISDAALQKARTLLSDDGKFDGNCDTEFVDASCQSLRPIQSVSGCQVKGKSISISSIQEIGDVDTMCTSSTDKSSGCGMVASNSIHDGREETGDGCSSHTSFQTNGETSKSTLVTPEQSIGNMTTSSEIDSLADKTSAVKPASGIIGFQTASGRAIKISEASLQKARSLMNDGNDAESIEQNVAGFQTAGGDKITISEDALQKARKLLSVDNELNYLSSGSPTRNGPVISDAKHDDVPRDTVGFHTSTETRNLLSDEHDKIGNSSVTPDAPSDAEPSGSTSNNIQQPSNVEPVNLAGKTVGFQTGRGQMIQVSASSLQKAKQLLSECDDGEDSSRVGNMYHTPHEESTGVCGEMVGFQTGRGRTIQVSSSSLQKAKMMLSDEHDKDYPSELENIQQSAELDSTMVPGETVGFQTGRGNHVSSSSLQMAKQMLCVERDEDYPLKDGNSKQSDCADSRRVPGETIGFQTGRGKKIQICQSSLQKARQLLSEELENDPSQGTNIQQSNLIKSSDSSGTTAFQTGRGKQIQVSASSLQKARQMLSEECDKNYQDIKQSDQIESVNAPEGTVGFQTARGREIHVSAAALQKAKQILSEECGTDHPPEVKTIQRSAQINSVSSYGKTVGFQTGRGKKVEVSASSLQKARKLLSENDDNNEWSHSRGTLENTHMKLHGGSGEIVGFQTGGGKRIQVSASSLQKAKEILSDEWDRDYPSTHEDIQQTTHMKSQSRPGEIVGFQTGGGKQIQVSASSLQKARQMLCDEHDVDYPSTVKDTQPTTDVKSRDCHGVTVGFQTGGGKKIEVSASALLKVKRMFSDESEEREHPSNVADSSGVVAVKPADVQAALKLSARAEGKQGDLKGMMNPTRVRQADNSSVDPAICSPTMPVEETLGCLSAGPRDVAGFQTGRGKKVHISDEALLRAKQQFLSDASNIGEEERNLRSNARCETKQRESDKTSSKCAVDRDNAGSEQSNRSREGTASDEKEFPHCVSRGMGQSGPAEQDTPKIFSRSSESGRRQNNQQRKLPTGQKPYKPPRRLNKRQPVADRHISPRHSNPSAVLSDRTNQLRSLHTTPPARPEGTAAGLSNGGPFAKPFNDVKSTDQSQADHQPGHTPCDEPSLPARWQMARELQKRRIQAKQGGVTKPEIGSLWRSRKQNERITLRGFVEGQHPAAVSSSELFSHGILPSTLSVRADNAEDFHFAGEDHFSPSCLESSEGVPLADGGRLVLNPEGLAGKREFFSALLDTPGVDPKLLSENWVFNHYRWIVWKLAAMEVAYPQHFGGRLLTPNWVLLQLKYRYDREVDHAQRPALRKILERDETASRRLVLCVASIKDGSGITVSGDNDAATGKSLPGTGHPTLELTDGWYSVPAVIDTPLAGLVKSGRIKCGTKLCVYGAEIIGSQDACSPLEIPAGLALKVTANSTRRACFDARLGVQPDPRPFPLLVSSLHPEGGLVGCVDIVVLRVYPMQFMEKLSGGGSIFRSSREEERAAAMHSKEKQSRMEELFAQTQRQFEANQNGKGSRNKRRNLPQRRSMNVSYVKKLQTGEELFEAMESSLDPAAFEALLSAHQQSRLHDYQRLRCDRRQADLQAAFNQAMQEQAREGNFERSVVPLLKLRIADYKTSPATRWQQTTFLTIWRPTDDLVSQLKEGKRFRVSALSASAGRNLHGMAPVQLASTRATRYEELPLGSHLLQKIYTPRAAASLQWLERGYWQAAYGELDVVGLVVSVEEAKPIGAHGHIVYLSDEDGCLMAIKFWAGLKSLHLEDLLKPGTFVAASNLQYRQTSSQGAARVPLPLATASDYSSFTLNPRAPHLQSALNQTRRLIKGVSAFLEAMRRKLESLKTVSSNYTSQPNPASRYPSSTLMRSRMATPLARQVTQARVTRNQSVTPNSLAARFQTPQGQGYQTMVARSCPKNFPQGHWSRPAPEAEQQVLSGAAGRVSGVGTAVPRSAVAEVEVSPKVAAQQVEAARRSQLLSRIPSPPPLTPLPCPSKSSAVRQGFKTPLRHRTSAATKAGPAGTLRKRLRDELGDDAEDSSQPCTMEETKLVGDGSTETKKQRMEDGECRPRNPDTESSRRSEEETKGITKEVDAFDNHRDLASGQGVSPLDEMLDLSASGIRELEMSWSQSQVASEPARLEADEASTHCTNVATHCEKNSEQLDVIHEDAEVTDGLENTSAKDITHQDGLPYTIQEQSQCTLPSRADVDPSDHTSLVQSDGMDQLANPTDPKLLTGQSVGEHVTVAHSLQDKEAAAPNPFTDRSDSCNTITTADEQQKMTVPSGSAQTSVSKPTRRRALSRRSRKSLLPVELIVIPDEESPSSQPKRSSRLRGQLKKNYKV